MNVLCFGWALHSGNFCNPSCNFIHHWHRECVHLNMPGRDNKQYSCVSPGFRGKKEVRLRLHAYIRMRTHKQRAAAGLAQLNALRRNSQWSVRNYFYFAAFHVGGFIFRVWESAYCGAGQLANVCSRFCCKMNECGRCKWESMFARMVHCHRSFYANWNLIINKQPAPAVCPLCFATGGNSGNCFLKYTAPQVPRRLALWD